MVNEDELRRRLRSKISEVALRHGRKMTSEMRAEMYAVCMDILEEHGVEDDVVEVVLDPVQDTKSGFVKVWVGGLPPLQIAAEPPSDEH